MKKETERENMRELTRAELEIMQILWDEKNAFVNDILERMPEPKPAYNTVSTIVRILEKKGAVGHEVLGKSHRYYPLVDREQYARGVMSSVLTSYFDGSLARMVSFFSRNEDISVKEMDEILEIMRNAKK